MNKKEVIHFLLKNKKREPVCDRIESFAPSNIALCKYWGKRNLELNLPMTSSLSMSLPVGATITITVAKKNEIILNEKIIESHSDFYKKLFAFIDLFDFSKNIYFNVMIQSEVPIAAGLASSACGFAAIVKAFNALCDWQLSLNALSVMARLGSGSAARSLWTGFVEWQVGIRDDGMDSVGVPLDILWPALCIDILMFDDQPKKISSREAMAHTVNTSILYKNWPLQVAQDLPRIKKALREKDFITLGETVEGNALAMHATMLGARPPICYSSSETWSCIEKIWQLRKAGLPVYFTQDAGPNLKLLFLKENKLEVEQHFSLIMRKK